MSKQLKQNVSKEYAAEILRIAENSSVMRAEVIEFIRRAMKRLPSDAAFIRDRKRKKTKKII